MVKDHLSFAAALLAFGGVLVGGALASHQPAGGGDASDVRRGASSAGPQCPAGSLFGQGAHGSTGMWDIMPADSVWDMLVYENFWNVSGLSGGVRWWGFQLYSDGQTVTNCTRSPDDVTVTFYQDDGDTPGAPACGPYTVSPTVIDTGLVYGGWRLYEFSVDISPTCALSSGWVSIQSTGGDPDCWLLWMSSPDGDGACYEWEGYDMELMYGDLSLCLMGQPIADQDGDGVPDDLDICPGYSDHIDDDDDGVPNGCDLCPQTPRGVSVDANGCMVFDDGGDDDDDGVGNKCDICPHTPACAEVNSVGCPIDSDGDGVYDGCDLCPGSSRYAVVDANGCAITDAKQAAPVERLGSCCGMAGPVAPLGLAVGMLLLSRVQSRTGRGTRE